MTKKEYQPLTIPALEWEKDSLSMHYGKLVAQPLAPGFGITLGNALRRVLLGGIEGSAVTSIIIKGVNNEFSALEGVEEDVMQVVLNCKDIRIRNKTGKPGKMRLLVKGPAAVRVENFDADEHLELINKDHIIAHVAAHGELDMTFFVEAGRGYKPAQWPIGSALQKDGRIYLDAMFSPLRRVACDVEKTRVGDDIDFDKLILTIETDGTVSPADVLHYAVSVLRTQLEHFLLTVEIPFNELSQPALEVKVEQEEALEVVDSMRQKQELLQSPLGVLELSVRAHNCLTAAGIKTVLDLVNMQEEDVLKIKNFGKKSFDEVKNRITELGLSFGMNLASQSGSTL